MPQVQFAIALEGDLDGFDEPVSLAIYRLLQEGVTNVSRHAAARRVEIRVATLELCRRGIRRGLVHHRRRRSRRRPQRTHSGLGLIGMRERIEMLGGRLSVTAAPACGSASAQAYRLRMPSREPPHEPARSRFCWWTITPSCARAICRLLTDSGRITVVGEAATVRKLISCSAIWRRTSSSWTSRCRVSAASKACVGSSRMTQGARAGVQHVRGPDLCAASARGRRCRLPDQGERPARVGRGGSTQSPQAALSQSRRRASARAEPTTRSAPRRAIGARVRSSQASRTGLHAEDVAKQLGLNQKTIANHQSSIKQKLGAGSTAQLFRIAMRLGLVPPV